MDIEKYQIDSSSLIYDNKRGNKFKEKYHDNIVSVEYYDNTKLLDDDCENYINKNDGSHFKIILKK